MYGQFFEWRMKVAIAALVLATVVTGLWFRSTHTADIVRYSSFVLQSEDGQLLIVRFPTSTTSAKEGLAWTSIPLAKLNESRRLEQETNASLLSLSFGDMTLVDDPVEPRIHWDWNVLGIAAGQSEPPFRDRNRYFSISYWTMTTPLIVISVFLFGRSRMLSRRASSSSGHAL